MTLMIVADMTSPPLFTHVSFQTEWPVLAVPQVRAASTQCGQFPEMIGEKVVDGHSVPRPVALHLLTYRGDRSIEVGVSVGKREFLFQEMITDTGDLRLIGEGN